jgi:pilin isopeptide linkage protein
MKIHKFLHIILVICALVALAASSLPAVAANAGEEHCEHVAHYDPTDPELMFDPPVRMNVFGAPAGDSVFTFKLAASDPFCPMPEGSKDGVKTVRITGAGETSFGTWSYTQPGAHYYTVSVVDGGEADFNYDTAVYTITDVVKAEDGALTLNRIITNKANKQVRAMNFISKYNVNWGFYSSNESGDATIVETKTENRNNNNYYYILMALGAILAIGAASDLILSYMRTNMRARLSTCIEESAG